MSQNEDNSDREGPVEVSVVGDLTDNEGDITEKLLSVPPGGDCTIYFDCPGGSPYTALSLTTIMLLRGTNAYGVVTGECSSAALWPLAACHRRAVTPHSILLFHPMKWQSEEHVGITEAAEWARHFRHLEGDMDKLLARLLNVPHEQVTGWMNPGRYMTGREFHEAGLAEMIDLAHLAKTASVSK